MTTITATQPALDLVEAPEALYAVHFAFADPADPTRPDPAAPTGCYPNRTRRQATRPTEYLCTPAEFDALVGADWTHTSRACRGVLYRVERQDGPWVYDPAAQSWGAV